MRLWRRCSNSRSAAADEAQRGPALRELPELVKRTALAAFPRQQVASLSGAAWLEFLDRTGHTDAFTHGRGQLLPVLSYDPHASSRLEAQEVEELFSVVHRWMRHHVASPQTPLKGYGCHVHPGISLAARVPWPTTATAPPAARYRQARTGLVVPFLGRLAHLTGQQPAPGAVVVRPPLLQQVFLWGVWVCLVLALARPQWLEPPLTKTLPTRDLLLAVDLSGSMDTQDFTDASGQKADRLTAVKQVLDEFLARRKGDRVGLIFFGSAAFVQAPFTEDLEACRTLLDEAQVRMAGPKTVFGDAIGLAITIFERAATSRSAY